MKNLLHTSAAFISAIVSFFALIAIGAWINIKSLLVRLIIAFYAIPEAWLVGEASSPSKIAVSIIEIIVEGVLPFLFVFVSCYIITLFNSKHENKIAIASIIFEALIMNTSAVILYGLKGLLFFLPYDIGILFGYVWAADKFDLE